MTKPWRPAFALEELTAIHAGHQVIQQNQARGLELREQLQRMPPVSGSMDFVTMRREKLTKQCPNIRIVVN